MIKRDPVSNTDCSTINGKKGTTENDGFLQASQRRQGYRQRQNQPLPRNIFWILLIGCMILFRLFSETALVRNSLALTKNQHLLSGSDDKVDFSPAQTSQTINASKSAGEERDEYTHGKDSSGTEPTRSVRPLMKDASYIFSGSTFRAVPSATNLLLPPLVQQQHRSCHETPVGKEFRDNSDTNHNYSDTNYVLHILGGGGGTCQQDDFGSFVRRARNNTIVTAYYEIPSKHPPHKYRQWMRNFLSAYRDPMVIFTSPDMVEFLAEMRHCKNVEPSEKLGDPRSLYFDTILVSLPLQELPLAQLYSKSFWVDQLDRDPQSAIHSPLRGDPRMQGKFESGELYWIWLSKIWFVTEATRIFRVNIEPGDPRDTFCISGNCTDPSMANGSDTENCDVFAWIDIGSFRKEDRAAEDKYPPPLMLRHPEVVPITEMLFWSHSSVHSTSTSDFSGCNASTKNYSPVPPLKSPYFDDKSLRGGRYFFHSGAHFAGRPRVISRFYRHFLRTIDIFVERNLTLADDQAVMQSTCLSYYETFNHPNYDSDKGPDNLCVYATRNMVGGKNKWFGLAKLFQNGFLAMNHSSLGINNSDNSLDSFWKPPPPTYYLENEEKPVSALFNGITTSVDA